MNKLALIVVLFFLNIVCRGQTATIIINIKSKEFSKNEMEVVFNRSDIGENGIGFSKAPVRYGRSTVKIKCAEPFHCYVELRKGDSVLQISNGFIVTGSKIIIEFDINNKFPVITGGENDFFFQNRFLLFAMPAVIAHYPGFSCKMLKEDYEFSTKDFRLQYYVNEYENNIISMVSSKKNYFVVLESLWKKVDCISLKTLERCYNSFTDTLKRTKLGKLLRDYISSAKELFLGKQLPYFTVFNSSGKEVVSDNIVDNGKYIFIDFWASWCAPCRAQMKSLKDIYYTLDTSKIKFISISIDANRDEWLKAAEEDQIIWPHYLADKGWESNVSKKFNLTYIPQNVLINPKGNIVFSNINIKELRNFVKLKSLDKEK